MFVEDPGIREEHSQLGQIATEQIASTFGGDHTARPLWQVELILDVDDLADVVKNLEAVYELASMLRVVEAWNHIRMELIFDSEIALEVLIKELEELLLKRLRCSALCE